MTKPTLVLTWVFTAQPQRVFDVFTQAEHLNAWFARGAQVDLQVGGRFSTEAGDKGKFLKVAVPRQLTLAYSHPGIPVETELDVTFQATGPDRSTQVRLVQKGLDPKQVSGEQFRLHVERWNWLAENLKRYLARDKCLGFEEWLGRTRVVYGTRD
jgi:uncharacterized protein YndB with AHSA1/START domain